MLETDNGKVLKSGITLGVVRDDVEVMVIAVEGKTLTKEEVMKLVKEICILAVNDNNDL